MFELFMYVYSCNALSARFFAVDRALNSYFMIMIMSSSSSTGSAGKNVYNVSWQICSGEYQILLESAKLYRRYH